VDRMLERARQVTRKGRWTYVQYVVDFQRV
jgi:hypothetical protein